MTRRRRPPRRGGLLLGVLVVFVLVGAAGIWHILAGNPDLPDPVKSPIQASPPNDNAHTELTWPTPSPTRTARPARTSTASPRRTERPSASATATTTRPSSTPTRTPTTPPTVASPPPPATTATRAPVAPSTPSSAATRAASVTTWYTSQAAVAAASRMASTGVVGDPVCSLSAVGQPDPAQVPVGVNVGVGESGNYWCLIWS